MTGLRYADVEYRDNECMDLTSLTQGEFAEVLPTFEAAFQERMRTYRLDGHQRTGRGYVTYDNCPLPTPEDRLLFILVYLKTNPLQTVHGRMFGMPQNKANQWIHALLPVLQVALRQTGDAPARTLSELKKPLREHAQGEETPLFATMALNDASHVHKTAMNSNVIIAAKRNATPSKMSS